VPRRGERTEALRQRYRAASKAEKGRLLDEFVAETGYHRKHAVRLLRGGVAHPRRRTYDENVAVALVAAWEHAGRVGSRRLKEVLPDVAVSLTRQGRLPNDLWLRARLIGMSAATIDRLLAPVRAKVTTTAVEAQIRAVPEVLADFATRIAAADLPPSEQLHLTAKLREIAETAKRLLDLSRGGPDTPDDV
jgi:hypothetical protein